jgi:Family of unknown function (DUF5990)
MTENPSADEDALYRAQAARSAATRERWGWARTGVLRKDLLVRVEVIGTDCPVLPGVTVGVQRRSEVVDEQPADGGRRTWAFDVEVEDGDFRGPYVHGRRGGRFVHLSWQAAGSGRFRRAKLMLDAIPAHILREALDQGLRAEVSLTMPDGSPLCAAARPPAVAWSPGTAGGPTGTLSEQ